MVKYVFSQHADKLRSAYETADSQGCGSLDLIFTSMGYFGIQTMGRILSESTDKDVRASVVEKLSSRALEAAGGLRVFCRIKISPGMCTEMPL